MPRIENGLQLLSCGTWLAVQALQPLAPRSQSCLATHNKLLYLICLFNAAPLVDCSGTDSGLVRRFMSSRAKAPCKKPPHVSGLAEPRAARETRSGPPPPRRAPPTPHPRFHGRSLVVDAAQRCVQRESLVSGSAIPCINFSLSSRFTASCAHALLCSAWKLLLFFFSFFLLFFFSASR